MSHAPRTTAALPAQAGIGLRAPHHHEVLAAQPPVAWFEVHSENFFARGGPQLELLENVRARYPLSLHGVGLSLGSAEPLDLQHVEQLRRLIARFEPAAVSEHLCWGRIGGRHANDLLPLPYTEEALQLMIARLRELQQRLGRQVLIENLSSYLEFKHSTLREWQFLAALAHESGCGILLDVNNIYVNARNHGFDAYDYLAGIEVGSVGEIHLAGHSVNLIGERPLLIDTHSTPVCDEVWALYAAAIRRFGRVPTLIEWDSDIPPLAVLLAHAERADVIAAKPSAVAA